MEKKNAHPVLRVVLILCIMLSFNVIAALAAQCAREHLSVEQSTVMLVAIVTIVIADLVFLYLLLARLPRQERWGTAGSLEDLIQKHYDGTNWDEAFRKAYAEWHDPRKRG